MPYSKILIAVDSSEYSVHAAEKGFELINKLNAEAALLFIVDLSRAMSNIDAGMIPQEEFEALKTEAKQTLDKLGKLYKGKKLSKLSPQGDPNSSIISNAEEWGADLIIMGTHGRTGLSHLFMGSVAEHTVRHSPIPVLVVPHKKQA